MHKWTPPQTSFPPIMLGVVSFSSRIIAASRAAESMLADAYIKDPLALVLAGERAMERVQVR